jgi:hypothetical protein
VPEAISKAAPGIVFLWQLGTGWRKKRSFAMTDLDFPTVSIEERV